MEMISINQSFFWINPDKFCLFPGYHASVLFATTVFDYIFLVQCVFVVISAAISIETKIYRHPNKS